MKLRKAHQEVVHKNVGYSAGKGCEDGDGCFPVGLEDGVCHENQAIENGRRSQNGQGRPCHDQGLAVIAVQKPLDGSGQYRKAHTEGKGNEACHPDGGFGHPAALRPVPKSQGCSDGWDDTHSQGLHQGRGEQIEGLGHGVNAVLGAGMGGSEAQRVLQSSQDDSTAQGIKDLQARGADGDGHRNPKNPAHNLPGGGDGH